MKCRLWAKSEDVPSKSIGKVSDTLDTYWMPQCPLVWENIFSISPICMNDVIFSKGRHVTDGGAGNLSYYIPLCNHISPQFRPTWLALQSNLISICFHPNFPFIMIQTYCNQINGRQVQRGRGVPLLPYFWSFFWRVKSLSNKKIFLTQFTYGNVPKDRLHPVITVIKSQKSPGLLLVFYNNVFSGSYLWFLVSNCRLEAVYVGSWWSPVVPSGCLWLMTAAKRYKGVKGAFSAKEIFFVFLFSLGLGEIGGRMRQWYRAGSRPDSLVFLKQYLKVGEMKNT